jgi:hypothetical protein
MQPYVRQCRPVEIKRRDGFANIRPQFIPVIGLGDDALAERLGDKTAVSLLRDVENQFGHVQFVYVVAQSAQDT